MKTLLIAVLCLMSMSAFAEDYDYSLVEKELSPKYALYLDINLASHHINTDLNLNEDNFGFGGTIEERESDIKVSGSIGYYENSYDRTSVYAAFGLKTDIFEYRDFSVQIGGLMGVVSGYEDKVIYMVLPTLTFGTDEVRGTFGYIPRLDDESPAAITFNVSVCFQEG